MNHLITEAVTGLYNHPWLFLVVGPPAGVLLLTVLAIVLLPLALLAP